MDFRKIAICCLVILLAFSLFGCKSPTEMAAEKVAEEMVEQATGVEADIDGDKVTVEGEGGKMVIGETEWPSDGLAKRIPEVKAGVVDYVMNSDTMCSIKVKDVELSDFEDYLNDIESEGFTSEMATYSTETNKVYSARNEEGIGITISYETEGKLLSVVAAEEAQ